MRAIFLTFVFLLSSTSLTAQQLPEWLRVYTFDESIIEMNTSLVTFISKDVSRVRFRWTFDQPQPLSGEPQAKYLSRLEVVEFNCSEQRYRPYHLTFLDAAGNIVRVEEMNPPGEWRASASMLYAPACALVKRIKQPTVANNDAIERQKVAKYAFSFSQDLEKEKDFKPLIEKFFAGDYLKGYLRDRNTNWFLNLNRETAAKASRAELERFYVASMNSGYLSSIFLISQYRYAAAAIPEEKLIPTDVIEFIDAHPYTAKYKGKQDNYDYLAANLDSVERLRSFTDLLEGISALMRKRVINADVEHSMEYQELLEDSDTLWPELTVCAADCLGLPKGTRLFDVNVSVLHLQVAEIKGKLRVVSARDNVH